MEYFTGQGYSLHILYKHNTLMLFRLSIMLASCLQPVQGFVTEGVIEVVWARSGVWAMN